MNRLAWAAALSIGLAGCGSSETASTSNDAATASADIKEASNAAATVTSAVATLRTAAGATAGSATATTGSGGIIITLNVEDLPRGQHGVHVHMTGRCDPPTFETAGAHWNPASSQHGLENPQGPHAGDMPNLTIGADGRGVLEYTLEGGTLNGLLDSDGSAIVVHADVDDQKTDPSGNSGDRIACGIFAPG